MELVLEALTYHRHSDQPLSVLIILFVRVTLVLVAGGLLAAWCGKRNAAWEHLAWLLTLLLTVLVPLVWAITPAWRVPLVALEVSGPAMRAVRAVQAGETLGVTSSSWWSYWPHVLVAVWIIGATSTLAHALWSVAAAIHLVRKSSVCRSPAWQALAVEVCQEMNLDRPVEVRWVARGFSPAVWGWRRVRVLVPEGSQLWSRAERKHVLLHELSHAARRDCWWRFVSQAVASVWWFHPLVWIAAVRLRAAGERAADDAVVRRGTDVAEYAQHLLAIAARLAGLSIPSAAPTMMRASQLESRLRNLLSADRDRAPLGAGRLAAAGIVAGVLLWMLATWTPSVVRAMAPPGNGTGPNGTVPNGAGTSGIGQSDRPATIILVRPRPADESAGSEPAEPPSEPAPGPNSAQAAPAVGVRAPVAPQERSMFEGLRYAELRAQVTGEPIRPLPPAVEPKSDALLVLTDPAAGKVWAVPAEGVRPAIPAPAAPKLQLLPNWDAGRKADAKLPNYRPGTAKVQLLNPPSSGPAEPDQHLEIVTPGRP